MKKQIARLLRGELIGNRVLIVNAKNKTLEGTKGRIVDETQHTLRIRTQSGTKRVLKSAVTIGFTIDGQLVQVDGKLLAARPHERARMKVK